MTTGSSSTSPPSRRPRPTPPRALGGALGVTANATGRNRFDWLVEVDGAAAVRALTPDLTRLATVPTCAASS